MATLLPEEGAGTAAARHPPPLALLSAEPTTTAKSRLPADSAARDTVSASTSALSDVSDAVTLVDAHAYEPEVFAAPSSPDQLRPFFSLKSALYAGRFAHTDTDTAIAVAVKFWLCPDQRLENEEARLEAALLREVEHTNVVRCFGLMTWSGMAGVVMELANHPHRTLEGHMRAVATGTAQRTRGDVHSIALGIARGLAHVHDCGLVHRDLKPNNVLLRLKDDGIVPQLCDFGSAQHIHDPEPRQTMGMWSFSPPVEQEQDAADARLDDVYRYALVLWCTLAARWPFDEALTGELSTEFEFLRAVNNGLRPAPLVGLSSAVQDLLHALWAREPSQRFPPEDGAPTLADCAAGEWAPLRRVCRCLEALADDPCFAPAEAPLGPLPLAEEQ